ncbi:hypothetical protein B7494_g4563 [Chlorociboria aeruginascens]|nr:hypothetical protein B7494_g4563 [Chlorociboria aeruginascens]
MDRHDTHDESIVTVPEILQQPTPPSEPLLTGSTDTHIAERHGIKQMSTDEYPAPFGMLSPMSLDGDKQEEAELPSLSNLEFGPPAMGYDFSNIRLIPSSPSSFLRPGSRFVGTQQSERSRYNVQVDIKHVDMRESFLCGYLRIEGLTEDHPTLTTYFEGEIIGSKYSFLTRHQEWGSTDNVDLQHWAKFAPFRPFQKSARKGHHISNIAQKENIFMRWKEHFLVPDHRVKTLTGASFDGFYYICFNQIHGTVNGIYFHSKSEKYISTTGIEACRESWMFCSDGVSMNDEGLGILSIGNEISGAQVMRGSGMSYSRMCMQSNDISTHLNPLIFPTPPHIYFESNPLKFHKYTQNDEFIQISTRPDPNASYIPNVSEDFITHNKGARVFTEGVIVSGLRATYPSHHLTISPSYNLDLISFAASNPEASYTPHGSPTDSLIERQFEPPSRRYNDEHGGNFSDRLVFGVYDYVFRGNEFLVYIVQGSDGLMSKPTFLYILVAPSHEGEEMSIEEKASAQKNTDDLIETATKWSLELHDEVLVFDGGLWQKNKELWQNVQKSNWEDVILEKEKKSAIVDDVMGFFDGQQRYQEFGVPWKRGVIFYGPPGNGKTISTKALMHDISKRSSPGIESLYVKSFKTFQGPEYGIRQIFLKARQMAPCLLIFEDIDSLVDSTVRSYFLNEVDGLESNHGILMIGSTNHLERLDPGIAKRPSRFDRKYFFDSPNRDERVQYCEYWRNKLKENKKIEFPREMSERIADLTDKFSFAYMKEAFVAALLVIVAKSDEVFKYREDDLSGNVLYKELKRQITALRKEMDEESEESEEIEENSLNTRSGLWPSLSTISDDRTRPIDINNTVPRFL